MNFTTKVKQELLQEMPTSRHCRIAELGGMISFIGRLDDENGSLVLSSENKLVIEKAEKLIKKIFPVDNTANIFYDKKRSGKEIYKIQFTPKETFEVCELLKMNSLLEPDPKLYTMTCCKRAYLRGAFLGTGTLTDPNKDYHFEMVCGGEGFALRVKQLILDFGIEAKQVERKSRFVVYIKDSEMIGETLNVLGAKNAMMELENIRILKDVRNHVNRQVNCDSANIKKALTASKRQMDDISYIRSKIGLECLSRDLIETAELREMYPEATLAELVMYNGGNVGKSGINHRLKKLSEIADKLRDGEKNDYKKNGN